MLEATPEDERRIMQRIAQRMAIRGSDASRPLRPISEEIQRLLEPGQSERRSAALRERLVEGRS